MKCPVCDQENSTMLCTRCGFDSSRDYEKYPTFAPVINTRSVSALRKERQTTMHKAATTQSTSGRPQPIPTLQPTKDIGNLQTGQKGPTASLLPENKQLLDLKDENYRLTRKIDTLSTMLDARAERINELMSMNRHETSTSKQLRSKIATLEAEKSKLAQNLQTKNGLLDARVEQVNVLTKLRDQDKSHYEAQITELTNQNERLARDSDTQRTMLDARADRINNLMDKINKLKSQSEDQIAELTVKNSSYQKESDTLRQDNAKLRENLSIIVKRLEAATKGIAALRLEAKDRDETIAFQQNEINRLQKLLEEEQNKSLLSRIFNR